jgi:uncharacterized protein YggE
MRPIQAAAASLLVAAAAAAPPATAQPRPEQTTVQGAMLTINASGTSEAAPDMATISLGVITDGPTAAAALAENSRRMNALMQALRRAGLAERDIQTAYVSVNPQYQYRDNLPPIVTGYQASNTVTAKVRNVDNVGRAIDAAVGAGGNTVNGISFSHQDPDAQLDIARRDAVAEARRRADLYAEALGMRVARVIAISEGGGYAPPIPMPVEARMVADGGATPVAPGQIETRVDVNITFELR